MAVAEQLLGPGSLGEFLAVVLVTAGVFGAVFALGTVVERRF